jgi:hypothetical protein
MIRMPKDPTIGKRIILGLSLPFAILVVFLYFRNQGTAATILFFGMVLVLFIVLFLLFYHSIKKVYPGSRTWGVHLWLIVLGGSGILIILTFAFLPGTSSVYGPVSPPGSGGSFSTYENPALGFRISYPGTWTRISRKDPNSDFVTNTAFISSDGKTVATVQVVDLTGPGYLGVSLDLWTNHSIELLRSNTISSQFTLLRSERTFFAGYPAENLEYTAVLTSGDRIRTAEYLLEAGSKGYNIGFTSREDTFNDWSGTEQQIFNSFRITG